MGASGSRGCCTDEKAAALARPLHIDDNGDIEQRPDAAKQLRELEDMRRVPTVVMGVGKTLKLHAVVAFLGPRFSLIVDAIKVEKDDGPDVMSFRVGKGMVRGRYWKHGVLELPQGETLEQFVRTIMTEMGRIPFNYATHNCRHFAGMFRLQQVANAALDTSSVFLRVEGRGPVAFTSLKKRMTILGSFADDDVEAVLLRGTLPKPERGEAVAGSARIHPAFVRVGREVLRGRLGGERCLCVFMSRAWHAHA
jgi:hypothetical protein